MFKKIINFIPRHKFISAIIIIVVAGGAYLGVKALTSPPATTKYVVSNVTKGTLITSISGSGQISASNQVDVKAKASGDALSVPVTQGQEVKTGAILVSLNAQDAQKTVRDAQVNLTSAQLSLAKLKQPADSLSILQAQNALTQAQQNKQNAQDNITKGYEDATNAMANAFLNLPTIIAKLNDILYSYAISNNETTVGRGQINTSALLNSVRWQVRDTLKTFETNATNDYQIARSKYDVNFQNYNNYNRYADPATTESLLTETIDTARAVAQAAKSENDYLNKWLDYQSQAGVTPFSEVTAYQTNLNTYIGQVNSNLSSLVSVQISIHDNQDALVNADQSIAEKTESLTKLQAGADPLDIQSQELSLQQRQNALLDAQEKLADYTVRAPFDGVIAQLDVKKSDSVASGGTVATLITTQQTAEISLNEVDAAKVKLDQKVTLTFDAIDSLSITGKVAGIDTLGTVSQGVVTYNVKIVFDTQDDRVKPGMSVSAEIMTNVKQDVLLVPSSAVKTQGNISYVEIFDQPLPTDQGNQGVASPTPPRQQIVEVGLSNDTSTEITSGLKEGDQVVTRTITNGTTQTSQSSAPSLFGGGGGGVAGGNATFRALGR